jgi:general secretion pathway protein B
MSFILDALKKSENERQRQVGPSLADVQVSQRRANKPWWVVAVAALLVLNLGVLLVVLMRDGDAKSRAQAAPEDSATTAIAPSDARAGTQVPLPASASRMPRGNPSLVASTDPAVRSLADEAGASGPNVAASADPHLSAAGNVPAGPPLVRPIEAPAVTPATIPPQAQSAQPAQDEEVLPTPNDLAASGTSLPELHLDIHVYSARPADRFVFVNMRKYTEGQALKEGPTLERITAEGAVLNHQGLRYLLPRQ